MPKITPEQIKTNYFVFTGRLPRALYQKLFLILFLINVALYVVGSILGWPGIIRIVLLPIDIILMVAAFSIAIRRFHDLGQTGWLSLLLLIPIVNLLVLLYLLFAPGTVTPNKYGIL